MNADDILQVFSGVAGLMVLGFFLAIAYRCIVDG